MSDTPFPTEIMDSRPTRTANRVRNRQLESTVTPYEKLKEMREKARTA